jgi:hypothetical protein
MTFVAEGVKEERKVRGSNSYGGLETCWAKKCALRKRLTKLQLGRGSVENLECRPMRPGPPTVGQRHDSTVQPRLTSVANNFFS